MRAIGTPEMLKLAADSDDDWELLAHISSDASGDDLAGALGALAADAPMAEDWRDFVLPDLRDSFSEQTSFVARTVSSARSRGEEMTIRREDAEIWYGALNQARLSLHARYDIASATTAAELKAMTKERRDAWFRSLTYQRIQSVLLDLFLCG